MFKWFAPLLLFAGKPDLLIRIVILAIAAAVVAFGVWLASNIAVTFDALKSPAIAAIYGLVLLCFLSGVGAVAWLRLRRLPPPRETAGLPRRRPEAPLPQEVVSRRAEEISRKWIGSERQPELRAKIPSATPSAAPVSAPAPATPKPVLMPARAVLTVTGPAYAGKTALIAGLVQASSANAAETSALVRLVDAGSIDGDERHMAALVTSAAATDGVLFVVDQDLHAPEVAAITRLVASRKPLFVALNKADQFNAPDRDTIMLSIRAKMPDKFNPGRVVAVSAAPSPIEREIEDARGRVRVELRHATSDIRALSSLLSHAFATAAGEPLRFEAA